MIVKTYVTTSEQETIDAGRDFAKLTGRPSVVLLTGNLGAGKTTFIKGVAGELTGLAPDEITSPTFTLIHDYGAAVFHLDLYRLERPAEIAALGIEDLLFDQEGILLIEWGERFADVLPNANLSVTLTRLGDTRRIEIKRVDLP